MIFLVWYLAVLTLAWWLMPPAWAALYSALLPYTGYYALLYRERAGSALRRTRTFLRFLTNPSLQRVLASEGDDGAGLWRVRTRGGESLDAQGW